MAFHNSVLKRLLHVNNISLVTKTKKGIKSLLVYLFTLITCIHVHVWLKNVFVAIPTLKVLVANF